MLQNLERDLKDALLGGNKVKVETLRGLKSAIYNEAIAQGAKDSGLNEEQIQKVLSRESKKRSEAAELYKKGGNDERSEAELTEKAIIDGYLPEQVDENTVEAAVAEEIAKIESPKVADMGKIIGAVKAKLGAGADGGTIARFTKQSLEQK